MIDPLELFTVGLWLIFVVWAIALNMCRDDDVGSADE
jgi:hypothetical protein